ncbi:hypothetical protein C8R44DRAFT_805057 [Mycena epipterygia]|nr:hypothetical protein C8R44DRAFT_805057 [Mycena epipterygia]
MVLEKRKRDGGFEPWRPAAASTSTPTASSSRLQTTDQVEGLPPAKKPRQEPIPTIPFTPTRTPTASYPVKATNPSPVASSSQVPSRSDSTPAKKARRKAGDPPAPKTSPPKAASPEKRGAVFKKKCPQNILDRVERVMSQRFFMVDRKRVEGELKEEFQVLGSTGNIYTVTIEQKPSCNCPDAQKGNHCKHILFIFLKVLQVSQASGLWYQKALLTTELESIFNDAPLAPNALAHPRIREAYARATGKAPSTSAPSTPEASGPKKRLPGEDDDCPICYDTMHGAAEAKLTFCQECGNAVHTECFAQWKQTSAKQRTKLTCIYCRAVWPESAPVAGGLGARTTSAGYLNMAGVAGVSPQRDTTTYYHGPRRGERYYGYNAYGDD